GEWWARRQDRSGWDPMARLTTFTMNNVKPEAIAVAREYLARRDTSDETQADLASAAPSDMLRRIGVFSVSCYLTEAGALLFCPAPRPWITMKRVDVEGVDIIAYDDAYERMSLREQIERVERLLDAANDKITLPGEFSERALRQLPMRSAREAVLNG